MTITVELVNAVWDKGKVVDGKNPNIVRQDPCGAWIVRDGFGDRSNPFGWEIDHILPLGTAKKNIKEIDDIENLRPMHWRNNVSKSNSFPFYRASMTSQGNKNVKSDDSYVINASLRERLIKKYLEE